MIVLPNSSLAADPQKTLKNVYATIVIWPIKIGYQSANLAESEILKNVCKTLWHLDTELEKAGILGILDIEEHFKSCKY